MKLLLCSEAFNTANTVQACVDLAGKPQSEIKVAIINEGFAVELGDKRWVLDNLNDVATYFPAELDIVDLLALPIEDIEARLDACDVIYVLGGNTDYLMHVFSKSGFANLLPKLLKSKIYVGSSAGSMVLGKRISTEAYQEVYGEGKDFGVTEYMGLVNLAIKPHMDSLLFPDNRAAILERVSQGLSFPVYGLRDDSAIVVDGTSQAIIGSEPYKLG